MHVSSYRQLRGSRTEPLAGSAQYGDRSSTGGTETDVLSFHQHRVCLSNAKRFSGRIKYCGKVASVSCLLPETNRGPDAVSNSSRLSWPSMRSTFTKFARHEPRVDPTISRGNALYGSNCTVQRPSANELTPRGASRRHVFRTVNPSVEAPLASHCKSTSDMNSAASTCRYPVSSCRRAS